ncbi:MAG: 2-phospho-L-lactate guanylyltransferase [Nocardioides sp.]
MDPSYVAVVPVKPPALGKSRLLGLSDAQRRALARAFALDTVAACLATPAVVATLVATDDAAFARDFAALGCATIPDGDSNGLNAALRQAVADARRRWPDHTPAALCADLPALRPEDLSAALAAVRPGGASFVADAEGKGTTLYTAPFDHFVPLFGVESRLAHLAAGALEVAGGFATLRRDVDDLDGLRQALFLGVGRETRRVAADLDLGLGLELGAD